MDILDEKEKTAQEFERQQREKKVAELFEIGLDDEEQTAGYHGMSLETLQFLIEQGHMPGYSRPEASSFVDPGDLFFVAIPECFPNFDKLTQTGQYESPDQHAAGYANDLGKNHYILKQLGLPFNDTQLLRAVMQAENDPESFELLLEKSGKTRAEIQKIFRDAKKRKGIVIALSKDLFTPEKLIRYGNDEADLRIQIPQGLTLEHIVGIEPQGQAELKFLQKLQEKYS